MRLRAFGASPCGLLRLSGEKLSVLVSMGRSDGDRAEFEYTWKIRGRHADAEGASIALPQLRRGDAVSVEVIAVNSHGRSPARRIQARVANSVPRVLGVRLSSSEEGAGAGGGGEEWRVDARGEDPDGDPVVFAYTWLVNGRESAIKGRTFPISRLKRGDKLRARVVASDGRSMSGPAETGSVEISNSAPDIVSMPPAVDATGRFIYPLRAVDADGDRGLLFSLVKGPEGMTIDDVSGVVSWQPRADQAGRHAVELAVEDRRGGRSTQSFELPIVLHEESG